MPELPSEYAASRERRRRAQLWTFVLILLASDAAMIFKVGYWIGVIPLALALACLVVALVSRMRRDQVDNPSMPSKWPAQVPAWVLRSHGVELRGRLKDTVELTGQLSLLPDGLEWRPSSGSLRLGAAPLTWSLAGLRGMSVTPLWGLVPMSLLHLGEQNGSEADIWLRASSDRVSRALAATQAPTSQD